MTSLTSPRTAGPRLPNPRRWTLVSKVLSVSGWTLISRVAGFARDVAMAAVLGAGPVMDAFTIAFRLPNHLRAIFGEGAFNAAFVPAYSRVHEKEGDGPARLFADRIFTLLLGAQIVLLAAALPGMPWIVRVIAPGFVDDPMRFELAVTLSRITFPYLLFIALGIFISGLLNAHERFAAAAAAPVLLNLCWLAALGIAFLFPTAGHAVAWGVAVAGVLEFALVWADARRVGLAPRLARPRFDRSVRAFLAALGPAVLGSAGVQLAMFADTIIVSLLPQGAPSALYYADRLYQLPVGVIGVAVGTVLLPEMSRLLAAGEAGPAHEAQNRAYGLTLALAAPFSVAFLVMPDLIVSAVFGRGAFDAAAADLAGAVLAAYAVGLPAIVLIGSARASFHARADTLTPVIAALAAVGVNIALKLILMGPLGVAGLALATACGAWANLILLFGLAHRRAWTAPTRRLLATVGLVIAASAALSLFAVGARPALARMATALPAWQDEILVGLLAAAGLLVYASCLLAGFKALGGRSTLKA